MKLKFRVFTNGKMINCGVVPNLMSDGFTACIDNYDSISRVSGDVMQYTGLKDKNGKELYHDDIYVQWGKTLKCDFEQTIYDKMECTIFDGDFEIIGNIYENTELLEQSK